VVSELAARAMAMLIAAPVRLWRLDASAARSSSSSTWCERDADVEQLGLQAAEGVQLRPFGDVGVPVAGGVEGGLGAEAGRGKPGLVRGGGQFVVLVIGETDVDPLRAAGQGLTWYGATRWDTRGWRARSAALARTCRRRSG
jgi:hypothetical protein